jgi:hypothetical protein
MFPWQRNQRPRTSTRSTSPSRRPLLENLEARAVPATLQVIHNSPYAVATQVDV